MNLTSIKCKSTNHPSALCKSTSHPPPQPDRLQPRTLGNSVPYRQAPPRSGSKRLPLHVLSAPSPSSCPPNPLRFPQAPPTQQRFPSTDTLHHVMAQGASLCSAKAHPTTQSSPIKTPHRALFTFNPLPCRRAAPRDGARRFPAHQRLQRAPLERRQRAQVDRRGAAGGVGMAGAQLLLQDQRRHQMGAG